MNKRFILLALCLVTLCLIQAQPALSTAPIPEADNYFYRSLDLFQTRGYYDDVIGLNGPALKSALHDLIHSTHTTQFSYTAVTDQMRYTDEDPNNTNNVIEIYTGWSVPKSSYGGSSTDWNKEHTWSKSHGDFGDVAPAGTDLHHLRPCDASVNSAKNNRDFDLGTVNYTDNSPPTGYTGFTGCKKTDPDIWEPRDADKGDVARMIFYMAVRYDGGDTDFDLELVNYIPSNGNSGYDPFYAKLTTLLQWHEADPPDAWELRRNERTQTRQGNRNPFIDYPGFAASIWGNVTPPTIIQFNPASVTTNEAAGTVNLSVQIINPSATAATTVQVSLSSGTASDIGNFTTRTVTFPAGTTANQNVSINLTDDALLEGTESLIFTLINPLGGFNPAIGPYANCTLYIEDNDIPAPVATEPTELTFTGFTANWNPIAGITDFAFDLSEYASFTTFVSGYQDLGVTGTSLALGGLNDGSTYYYRLRAVFNSSYGAYSNLIQVSTPLVITLSDPLALEATSVSHEGFTAHWNSVTGADGYYLYVYEGSSPQATDLIISEYVEGTSNNKYLEIFNGTGMDVNLTDYQIKLYANAATSPTSTQNMTGTLTNGAAAVFRHSNAILTLPQGVTPTISPTCNFNGNDAIVLYKVSTASNVDIFGNISENPASWGTAPLITVDKTLRRKPGIFSGVTSDPTTGFPTLATDWDSYPVDTADGLGSHSISVAAPVPGFSPLTAYQNIARVEGLDPSTQYSYKVVAFNASSSSGNSNLISVNTAPIQPGIGANTSISGAPALVQVANLTGYSNNTVSIDPAATTHNDFSVAVNPLTGALRYSISADQVSAHNGSYILNHAGLGFTPLGLSYGLNEASTPKLDFSSTANQTSVNLSGLSGSGDLVIELKAVPFTLATPQVQISQAEGMIVLSWPEVPFATSYRIEATNSPNVPYEEMDIIEDNTWSIAGDFRMFFRVTAIRDEI